MIQTVAINLYGIIIILKRYNFTYLYYKNKIKNNEKKSDIDYKDESLKSIYNHALKSEFWYKTFKNLNIYSSNDFVASFKELPIIDKLTLKNHYSELISSKMGGSVIKTSGSTGTATKIYRNKSFESIQWAYWWRYRNNLGIKGIEKNAHFSSKMITASVDDLNRESYITRQSFFNTYFLNEENSIKILKSIKNKKIKWIHGFPSAITILAETNLKYKILKKQMKWITTGGENLSENQKATIEKSFDCKVREHYGLAEGVANFSECKNGHLHVDEDFSFVEFIPYKYGGYKIVGTSYYNTKMPLIRFDTGDLISSYRESDCEFHTGRIVKNIDGRRDDYIILRDGSKMARLSILFTPFTEISEAQIVQDSYDDITIYISVSDNFNNNMHEELKNHIDSYLLDRIDYTIKFTDQFVKTSSSKQRFIIRRVENNL